MTSIVYAIFMAAVVAVNTGLGAWNLANGNTIGALNLGVGAFLFCLALFSILVDD